MRISETRPEKKKKERERERGKEGGKVELERKSLH